MNRRNFLAAGISLLALPGLTIQDRIDGLWSTTGKRYLQEDLWKTKWAYDAGHVLLPSLLLACRKRSAWLRDFQSHFERFLSADADSLAVCKIEEEAVRLHYLYLVAQYCKERTPSDDLANRLAQKLLRELVPYYSSKPVWGWDPAMFPGGIKGRVTWKLDRPQEALPSYYSAIFDVDLFTLCALCDLAPFATSIADKARCADAAALAGKVLKLRGVFLDDGGWLFQPGVWFDHRDYAYAGWQQLEAGLQEKPLAKIAEDSSHSHRFPMFLLSVAQGPDPEAAETARLALRGLSFQFATKVLVAATQEFPAPRITNYMDGSNGIYRYGYETVGNGRGYGPYQLSGILAEGWWGLLRAPTVLQIWEAFAAQFPLPAPVLDLYVGPNTYSPRYPLVAWPNFFTNGFAQISVHSVVELGRIEDRYYPK